MNEIPPSRKHRHSLKEGHPHRVTRANWGAEVDTGSCRCSSMLHDHSNLRAMSSTLYVQCFRKCTGSFIRRLKEFPVCRLWTYWVAYGVADLVIFQSLAMVKAGSKERRPTGVGLNNKEAKPVQKFHYSE